MEKTELIASGERALDSLRLAREEMGKAFGWGIADILGGGLIISLIKRSKMNNARDYAIKAKNELMLFAQESKDFGDIPIDTSFLLEFGDYMEWLIADIFVQAKISKAKNKLDESIAKLEEILHTLKSGF